MPLISVIIPTLNEEKYLPLLLKDLSRQTYKDFEVIVVDSHSDDNTVKKAETFSQELPYLTILNSPHRSVSRQRNLGAKNATGDYFLFTDADNRLPIWFIEGIVYRIHQTNPAIFTCWLDDFHYKDAEKIIPTILNYYLDIQSRTSKPFALEAMMGFKNKVFFELGQFNHKVPVWEGANMLQIAHKYHYHLQVFRDPKYTTSLRRINTQGKFKTIVGSAYLEFSRLLNLNHSPEYLSSLYPVLGGTPKSITGNNYKHLLKTVKQILTGENQN